MPMVVWIASMPNKALLPLTALIIVALAAAAYLSLAQQSQFALARECAIGGPGILPIESTRDRVNANKAAAILWKVKDDMALAEPLEICVKKIKEVKDGILDCYMTKSSHNDEFIKICFAPRGALFSLEFQE